MKRLSGLFLASVFVAFYFALFGERRDRRLDVRVVLMNAHSGRVDISRRVPDVFVWGRLVGPAVVGLDFSAGDSATFYLPIAGKYRLSVISIYPVPEAGLIVAQGERFYTDIQETPDMILTGGPGERRVRNSSLAYFEVSPSSEAIFNLKDTRPVQGYTPDQYKNATGMRYHFYDGKSISRECVENASISLKKTNRMLCVVGDSHMRFLTNELIYYLDERNNYLTMAKKSVARSDVVVYIQARWYNEVLSALSSSALDSCAFVFFNFGLWPLSYQVREQNMKPYTLERYHAEVKDIADRFSDRDNFIWLTIEPSNVMSNENHPWQRQEFRHISMIQLWNKRTRGLFTNTRIKVIDVYNLLLPVVDLTLDSDHRSRPMLDCVVELVFRHAFPMCIRHK